MRCKTFITTCRCMLMLTVIINTLSREVPVKIQSRGCSRKCCKMLFERNLKLNCMFTIMHERVKVHDVGYGRPECFVLVQVADAPAFVMK